MDLSELPRRLKESRGILAGRIAKEALRLELKSKRVMTPVSSMRSDAARAALLAAPRAARSLADRGFCVVDNALSVEHCRVLYDHFDAALKRGELFGHVSSDACNKGSFSLSLPVMVGAGPDPDPDAIRRELAKHPDKAQAFAKAAALRAALRVMTGAAADLADALNADAPSFALHIPPTVMCACYPPRTGACYHKHRDWYPYEASNDRELTAMLYLNADWQQDDGGELAIHTDDGRVETILPLPGRLVFFFSRTVWHEVRPSHKRHRFAFTLWLDRPKGPP